MATLFLKGWKGFSKAIDPKHAGPILKKHVGRATARNGHAVRKLVRQYIKAGVPPENKPLTALFKKGSTHPITGTPGADLFNSIASVVHDWRTAYVGATRAEGDANIAEIVHEGRVIKVTDKMRGMFWLLWLVSRGRVSPEKLTGRAAEIYQQTDGAKGIKPIAKATQAIVIPRRPYLQDVIEDPTTHQVLDTNWTRAVAATLKEMAEKGMKV